jgi:hypothetical protein
MSARRFALAFAFVAAAGIAADAQSRDPCVESRDPKCIPVQQARCRQAIDMMLRTIRDTPLERPRDVEDAGKVIARVEKMLADNRSRGVDDCTSWGELGRIVAHQ